MSEANDTPQVPAAMRAVSQDEHGGPEVLHLVEKEVPSPGVGEVLVKVRAAGVNPTDYKHRSGRRFLGDPPYVLGWDVSGTVAAVGLGVTLFRPGDEVFGMLPYPWGAGAHAEYAVGPARAFAAKPAELDHVQAAAVPLAALTAWQALVDTADVQAGQRVLVHAAAGGVGHFAVQIAKARGAYVIGTASAPKHGFVRGLGADEVVDHREQDPVEAAGEVDVVLDTLGGETPIRSLRALRPGGIVVSILPTGTDRLPAAAAELGVRGVEMIVEDDHAGMRAIAALARSGALRPEVAGVFPLEKAADAHRQGETGRVAGKLVLSVSE
ncbi:NADP-dependent oxidoreductase [Nocardiopsis potens]|uniref:NADP-dependent oxidoreductase n=1 Tax=Nocardiopsis potens TaxID=1246458 RepID=UPI00037BBA47